MRTYFATREGSVLASWLSPEQMREQELTLHPSDYARFWLCKWTEPQGSWITAEMYDAAEVGKESLKGDPQFRYVGGVDIGLVRDLTAIAVCHAEGDRTVLDQLLTLKGSRDAPVELEVLESVTEDLTKRFGVSEWVFEAPQAVASVQRLEKRLRRATVSARYPTAESVARQFGGLYQLFANHRLVLYPHEQLRREALNLVTKTVGGRLKVVESSAIHQDCVVALGIACDLLIMEAEAIPASTSVATTGGHWWDPITGALRSSIPAPTPTHIVVDPETGATRLAPGNREVIAASGGGQLRTNQLEDSSEPPPGSGGTMLAKVGYANPLRRVSSEPGEPCGECGRSDGGHFSDCSELTRIFGIGPSDWESL